MSVMSGARSLLTDDVRVGLQRVIQVFITHSANVFLVESPPPPPPTVHTTGREVTTVTGDQPLRLEDQVSQCAGLILYTCYRVSLHFNGYFTTWISQLASLIEAKDDGSGGDNWSYKSCKAPVKSSSATNQHPVFYRPNALPVAQPTVSECAGEWCS